VHLPTLRPDAVARSAAVVMVACAAMHATGAVQHWALALSLPMLGVAAVCLHCVHHLWVAPRVVDWVWVTLGSAAMLVLHLVMLAQPTGFGHAHVASPSAGAIPVDPLTALGLALPLVGLALAWWGLGPVRGGSFRVGVAVDDDRADRRRDR
jgi:hypothetical protein